MRTVSLAVRAAGRRLVTEPDTVFVGLSGGADSLALAVAAIDWFSRQGVAVNAVTVDHAMREGSAEESERIAAVAKDLGATTACVVRVETGATGGPETRAREARREALRDIAAGAPILLGHTVDDQAETVLMRLGRGSGAGSLRAMDDIVVDERGTLWVRPLLEGVRRADTLAFCDALGLEVVADPTNAVDGPWRRADGGPLVRQAVRERVMPALADALGQDPVPALARTARMLGDDDDALEIVAQDAYERAFTGGTSMSLSVDVRILGREPAAIRRRVIHQVLSRAGRPGDLRARDVEAVDRLLTDWHGQGPLSLPGVTAARTDGEILFTAVD